MGRRQARRGAVRGDCRARHRAPRRSSPATRSRSRRCSRLDPDDPLLTDRFELFIDGHEYANGYSELNDPVEQRRRFEHEATAKDAGDDEPARSTRTTCARSSTACRPTGGLGIGDRPAGDAAGRRRHDPRRHPVPDPATGRSESRDQRRASPGGPGSRPEPPRATLDVWFRWLGWGELGESAPEEIDAALAGGDRTDDGAPGRGPPDPLDDRRRRAALVGGRRVPAPAPAVAPVGRPRHDQPRRHLRAAQHRGVDRPRPGRRRRPRRGAVRRPGRRGGASPFAPRQVPTDADYVVAERGAHRRRLTRAPRRPPRRGHRRDARGLLQLQRRHARRVDGGGADLARA